MQDKHGLKVTESNLEQVNTELANIGHIKKISVMCIVALDDAYIEMSTTRPTSFF